MGSNTMIKQNYKCEYDYHIYKLENKKIQEKDAQKLFKGILEHEKKQYQENKVLRLSLSTNELSMKGCEALARADFKKLVCLNIDNNNIGDTGCKFLLQSEWDLLFQLNLSNNHISVKGCRYIAKGNWPVLKMFQINKNNIRDRGCKQLVQGKWALQLIYLTDNRVTQRGCRELSKAGWIPLQAINLYFNPITSQGFKIIKPKCEYAFCNDQYMQQ